MKEGSSTALKAHQIIKKLDVQAPLKKWRHPNVEEVEKSIPGFLWIKCHTVRHLTEKKHKKVQLESTHEVGKVSSAEISNLIATDLKETVLVILPSEKLS